MSKKDRLKKQSQKQLEAKKAAERDEKQQREKVSESKSARRLRKSVKKADPAASLLLKILMCIPFLWSGLYYGGIFILGISMGQMDDVPGYVAALIGIGSAVILAGIVLAFLSKYVLQFVLIAAGTIVFMKGASFIVNKASERVGEGYGLTQEQKDLPSKWSFGLYPIMAVTALSALLLLLWLIKRLAAKRRRQRELDNAPVKSIVD
ncbi:hypothetical protein SAMN02910317_00396 [Ruminococcaceae bacterium FB2012]|nr:hypothetical protein SAMN02910317_00396 [Ruminococcaceae bacterium FB2012]